MKGDLLEGARNVPTSPQAMTALFQDGLPAFWRSMRNTSEGLFAKIDFKQVCAETERLFPASLIQGNASYGCRRS